MSDQLNDLNQLTDQITLYRGTLDECKTLVELISELEAALCSSRFISQRDLDDLRITLTRTMTIVMGYKKSFAISMAKLKGDLHRAETC
jgi:hypothetical protein